MDYRALELLACPSCGGALVWDGDVLRCPADGTRYPNHPPRLPDLRLPTARGEAEGFAAAYRAARLAEGWQPLTAGAALTFPESNLPGLTPLYRAVRRASWDALEVLLGTLGAAPLLIADLGAGFPWLSHRLAMLGHRVVAVDLSADPDFGLGAARLYPTACKVMRAGTSDEWPYYQLPYYERLEAGAFWPVLGDLERPPLAARVYDAVICNASLHYARELPEALRRMARTLRSGGALIVVDSPIASVGRPGKRPGSRILGREELAGALAAAGLTAAWTPVRRGWRWTRHRIGNWLLGRPDFDFPVVAAIRDHRC